MQHAGLRVVLVAALEVVFGVDGHVGGGHLDILVVADVHAGRIVHLVVGAGGDGEAAHGALAVIEHGVDVGREHALIGVVDLHRRIGPPEEGLRQRRAVGEAPPNLKIGATRTQREADEALLVEHALLLVAPDGDAAVLSLFDGAVHRQIGRRTMVLRPVELDAAADPGARQSDKRRLDDVIVIDKVALAYLVVGHLHASAQFGQYHDFQILVLQIDGVVVVVGLLVGDALDDGVGIYDSGGALIDSLLEEYGVLLFASGLVGRDGDGFSPGFGHFRMVLFFVRAIYKGMLSLSAPFPTPPGICPWSPDNCARAGGRPRGR